MKKIFLLILIVHCTLNIENCMCQWQWVNPYPTANTIYSVKFVNTLTGYAVCESGTVLKTVNGGNNWSVIMLNTSANMFALHFFNANTGFVGGEYGTLYKTTNGGNNWTKISVSDSVDFRDIRFRNSSTGIMVTGYYSGNCFYRARIYKTTDGGSSWSIKGYGGQERILSIAYATSNKIFAASNGAFFFTTDAGETWDTVANNNFQKSSFSSVCFANAATGYVFSNDYGSGNVNYICKTTDTGATWTKYNTGNFSMSSISFLNASTGIGVGRYTAVYRTTNGGVNWTKLPNAADSLRIYTTVTKAGTNRFIYAGEGGMIYRSTDAGANFTRMSKSFYDGTVNYVSFINSQTGLLCGNNGAIFKTINGGLNWTQQNCPNSSNIIKAKLFDKDTGIAVSNNGRVYKTINGGSVWNLIHYDTLAAGKWSIADFADSRFIYISGGQCAHSGTYTTDGGLSWNLLFFDCNCAGPPIPTGCSGQTQIIIYDRNHYVIKGFVGEAHFSPSEYVTTTFNGGNGGGFGFSTEMGGSFSMSAGYADSSNALLSINYEGISHIYRTTDGFRTVVDYGHPVNPHISGYAMNLVDSLNGLGFITETVNLSKYFSGIYKTTNGGQSWNLSGAVSNSLNEMKYYKFNLAVAWGPYGGIVKNVNPGIITSTHSVLGGVPVQHKLFQNYPNPFNPNTIIKFQIKDSRLVTLKVYDILGKEVATLVNEKQQPGTYEMTFDGSGLASGIYFYKLTAGDFSEVKRMVLIK